MPRDVLLALLVLGVLLHLALIGAWLLWRAAPWRIPEDVDSGEAGGSVDAPGPVVMSAAVVREGAAAGGDAEHGREPGPVAGEGSPSGDGASR